MNPYTAFFIGAGATLAFLAIRWLNDPRTDTEAGVKLEHWTARPFLIVVECSGCRRILCQDHSWSDACDVPLPDGASKTHRTCPLCERVEADKLPKTGFFDAKLVPLSPVAAH
jgi:hypothetical protein